MMTPQEVASHVFSKATLGGYNMAMVDEFLDALTEDYTTLYNDNAILKNKLKVLSDTVEEYRATDAAMRKTLLAAQQMAESIVGEAEKKKETLVQDAEAEAQQRLDALRQQYADEEYRLRKAKEACAEFTAQARAAHSEALLFLEKLDTLTGGPVKTAPAVQKPKIPRITIPAPVEPDRVQNAPAAAQGDVQSARRFEDLQYDRNYEIS